MSTDLPSGESLISYWYALDPLRKAFLHASRRLSKWIVEAISLEYKVLGQPSLLATRAHSSRNTAASKALMSGVSIQEVCDAAGCSWPLTFVRFYDLDLDAPGSRVVMS